MDVEGEVMHTSGNQYLNNVDVAETGFWFCLGCKRISEPKDFGEVYARCAHCGKVKLEWRDPVRRGTKHEKERINCGRKFALLASHGFYFCLGCGRITTVNGHRACIMCNSQQVDWIKPGKAGGAEPDEKPIRTSPREAFAEMRAEVESTPAWDEKVSSVQSTNNNSNNHKTNERESDDSGKATTTTPDPNAGKLWRGK